MKVGEIQVSDETITMMTSSKSVKIGNWHNFLTKCPLVKIEPNSFFYVLFQKKDDWIKVFKKL